MRIPEFLLLPRDIHSLIELSSSLRHRCASTSTRNKAMQLKHSACAKTRSRALSRSMEYLAGLSERFGHRIIILTGDLFVTVKVSARSCLTGTFFLLRNWQIQALKKDFEDAKNEEQEGSNGRSASGEGPAHETKQYQSLLNSFYTFQCQCCDAPSSESA